MKCEVHSNSHSCDFVFCLSDCTVLGQYPLKLQMINYPSNGSKSEVKANFFVPSISKMMAAI